MANPQKENGYAPIANEILEALARFRIPGECRQILDAIFRKTYGFNKKQDRIANSQLVDMTGMKKQNTSRSLSRLIEQKLVIKSDDYNADGFILKINKDYHDWIPFIIRSDDKKKTKKLSSKQMKMSSEVITPVIRSDVKVSSEVMDTKDKRHSKDKQKKGDTPAHNAKMFFKGVEDLKNKVETEESKATQAFLRSLQEKYPGAPKDLLWGEIKKFWSYWTELNATGRKERWQKQDAFQVERRLGTWFSKITQFKSAEKPKRKIV